MHKGNELCIRLTAVVNAPVFAIQAEAYLLLLDDALILSPQAGQVAREYKGVAVQTRAVVTHVSAGVVDGVVVIVGVDHPVVVVCERQTRRFYSCVRAIKVSFFFFIFYFSRLD